MGLWDSFVDFFKSDRYLHGIDVVAAQPLPAPSEIQRPFEVTKEWFDGLPEDLQDALFAGFKIIHVRTAAAAALAMLDTTVDEIRKVRREAIERLGEIHPDQKPDDPKAGDLASKVISAGNRMQDRRKKAS